MASLIPTLGLRGIYKLADPFAAKLLPQVAYTCMATRTLGELLNAGIDPYNTYYIPNNLTKERYETDLTDGMVMLSLQAGAGVWVDVPSTFVLSMPDLNGIPYSPLVAALRLGAVPDDTDLTYTRQRLADVVLEELGVVATCELVIVGQQTLIAQEDHELAEASRAALKGGADTDYSKYLEQKARADSLAIRVAALEELLIAQAPPPPN